MLSAASVAERFLSLVGLASLSVTAYIMRTSPLRLDPKGKKPMSVADERLAWIRAVLVPANGAVCLLLAVLYCFIGAGSSYGTRPVLYFIPGGGFLSRCILFSSLIGVYNIRSDHVPSHARDHSPRTTGHALGRPHISQRSPVRIQRRLGPISFGDGFDL